MSGAIEVTDFGEAERLLEGYQHRVVLHQAEVADMKSLRLLWDPVHADEPPAEAMLRDLLDMVEGERATVLLSCAAERRRDFVVMFATKLGWHAGVSRLEPAQH